MDEKVKQLWIDALNSGEYTQTKGKLRDDTGFCCLGVLTDIAVKEGVVEWGMSGSLYGVSCADPDSDIHTFEWLGLPYPVAVWAGLENEWEEYREIRIEEPDVSDRPRTLGSKNDNGTSFIEISKLIGEKL